MWGPRGAGTGRELEMTGTRGAVLQCDVLLCVCDRFFFKSRAVSYCQYGRLELIRLLALLHCNCIYINLHCNCTEYANLADFRVVGKYINLHCNCTVLLHKYKIYTVIEL